MLVFWKGFGVVTDGIDTKKTAMLGSIFEFEQKEARTNGKKKYDQQIYPRLMPPTDILVAYDQQILPYLNIRSRYCKLQ